MAQFSLIQDAFIRAAKEIRERLGEADIGAMRFIARAQGCTLSGDLKVEYELADETHYGGVSVVGSDIAAILDEFLRRKGWTDRNRPLCLPRVENEQEEV